MTPLMAGYVFTWLVVLGEAATGAGWL